LLLILIVIRILTTILIEMREETAHTAVEIPQWS
jgi:hypothetical protein